MGRTRKFSREDVLAKAMPLFWRQGFAGTSMQDIEKQTGVNKSGLYAEFAGKEDIFLASLAYYLETRGGGELLQSEPLGWDNIQAFLIEAPSLDGHRSGCFSISSLGDLGVLPNTARQMSVAGREALKSLFRPNVAAVSAAEDVDARCDMIATFFAGLCIEATLAEGRAAIRSRVESFMAILRAV